MFLRLFADLSQRPDRNVDVTNLTPSVRYTLNRQGAFTGMPPLRHSNSLKKKIGTLQATGSRYSDASLSVNFSDSVQAEFHTRQILTDIDRERLLFTMASDEIVWQIINNQHCSFKLK
jgi:hypothetical protein